MEVEAVIKNYDALIPDGESGFSALFGGWHAANGNCAYLDKDGSFWSSSAGNDNNACYLIVISSFKKAALHYAGKLIGFSVRCIRD